MESLIDAALKILTHVPYDLVLQALAAAGVLSMVLQKFKKWFEVQSNAVINWINAAMAFVAVAIQYLMNAATQNPSILPGKALALMSLTVLVYHAPFIGIKSLSQLIADVKETRERKDRVAVKETVVGTGEVPLDSVVPQYPPVAAVSTTTPERVAPATPDEFAA